MTSGSPQLRRPFEIRQEDISPPGGALSIAVLIPCYNEEAAIEQVVKDFRAALPAARLYVYDNNSSDRTAEIAAAAGAIVRHEPHQGKGHVVRRMFADVEADVYIMIDGDDTYDVSAAPALVEHLVRDGLDMVNAARDETEASAYRPGHKFGNVMLTGIVRAIFGDEFRDMLSGYRVFSRRFVKSFPMLATGFEIETELTIHALELQMPTCEVATPFKERPPGSESKLNTISDGIRILMTISRLLRQERPMAVFAAAGAMLAALALGLAYPIVVTFLETGLVPRFPTAILSTGLMLAAFLSFTCGLILDTVTRGRKEAKRVRYLAVPGVHAALEAHEATWTEQNRQT
ncbi:MAG: glycosyltransferase family 2 protein [Pseudomonadota bacterium]